MWKGLGFLLPFLYIGYGLQLYNAYVLYHLSYHPSATWPVPALSATFMILGVGNIITTSGTIFSKLKEKRHFLKYGFTRLDKYFWTHRKRRITVAQTNKKLSDEVEKIMSRSNTYSSIKRNLDKSKGKEEVQEENSSQTSDEIDLEEIDNEVRAAQDLDDDDGESNDGQVEEKKNIQISPSIPLIYIFLCSKRLLKNKVGILNVN